MISPSSDELHEAHQINKTNTNNQSDECNIKEQQKPQSQSESESEDTMKNKHKNFVRRCLDNPIRVTLSDGRVIHGTLHCFDNLGNMILSSASDVTLSLSSSKHHHHRHRRQQKIRLGTVLVPGHVSRRIKIIPKSELTNNTKNTTITTLTSHNNQIITSDMNTTKDTKLLSSNDSSNHFNQTIDSKQQQLEKNIDYVSSHNKQQKQQEQQEQNITDTMSNLHFNDTP